MNPVTALSLGRIGVGAAALAKPDLVAAQLGTTTSSPLITQWFGSREIALGAATLLTSGGSQKALFALGMAVDAADAATAAQAMKEGTLARSAGTPATAVAGVAVLVGLLGLLGVGKRKAKKKAAKAAGAVGAVKGAKAARG